MSDTKIEWTDKTWNPVTGCTKISPGCAHCYAEAIEKRFKRNLSFLPGEAIIRCHPERLEQPLKWRKPQRIFVNSMSDLFHEDVPFAFIDEIFWVMSRAEKHTFQILTKRPERTLEWFKHLETDDRRYDLAAAKGVWPLPNVHLGVSVENQRWAYYRIATLLQTPAAVRFVSYEPALKAVDFTNIELLKPSPPYGPGAYLNALTGLVSGPDDVLPKLDQIIIGGESGPKARPCEGGIENAIRQTIEQCKAADVAVFVKQMGTVWAKEHGTDSKGGDMEAWPDDLRIREYPSA